MGSWRRGPSLMTEGMVQHSVRHWFRIHTQANSSMVCVAPGRVTAAEFGALWDALSSVRTNRLPQARSLSACGGSAYSWASVGVGANRKERQEESIFATGDDAHGASHGKEVAVR